MKTRTGNFPIGFRRLWMDWHKDLSGLIKFSHDNGLEGIDLGRDADTYGATVQKAGLRLGSIDLKVWQPMLSPDKRTRKKAVAENAAYVKKCAELGPMNHFVAMLPENPELPRAENFNYMVDSFSQLVPTLEACDAKIVVEGWPGPGALVCTPEGYRSFFKAVPSKSMGVNYDPSHLLRMGIDPIRFLREFVGRVYHAHGKDTELNAENLYEYGHEQPPTHAKPVPFGNMSWRYTIPGQGQVRWVEVMNILKANKYRGMFSIELEDAQFNGTEAGERRGIVAGAQYLASV
jgi:sugar phosphate isomerase/epimerase